MEYAWNTAIDMKTQTPYYYNTVTREVTWDKPALLVEPPPPPKKARVDPAASLGRRLLGKALSEIGKGVLSDTELNDLTDSKVVEFLGLQTLQCHVGFDWSGQMKAGMLTILDAYDDEGGSMEDFGDYLLEAFRIPLDDFNKDCMLQQLKSKCYTDDFITNVKVVATAMDTIQERTGCSAEEAKMMLECEGEQSFENMNFFKKVDEEFRGEFENEVLDAIVDAIENAEFCSA